MNIDPSTQGVSRRSLTKGAAWAAPTLVAAGTAPRLAASPERFEGCCYQLAWSQFALGTAADGQVATTSRTSGTCAETPTVALAVSMTGTPGTVSGTTGSSGKYSSTFNGRIDHRGEQTAWPANDPYPIAGLSATGPGLILNTGYNTQTSVTFTFPVPAQSVTLTIYDITRSTSTTGSNSYRYSDTVAFSRGGTMSGDMTSANRTDLPAGATFSRTAAYESSRTRAVSNTFTTTDDVESSTFTVTYSAPVSNGWQFIALGPMSVCF